MKKYCSAGIIIIAMLCLMIAPAAACHAYLEKTGPAEACNECDITYTIHVTHDTLNGYSVKVVDTLPAGVSYVSSSDGGSYTAGKVTWIYNAGSALTKDLTVTVKTGSPTTSLENFAESWVKPITYGSYGNKVTSNTVKTVVKDCTSAPEFPTLALPAGLIIGMVGVVLFIQKSKED